MKSIVISTKDIKKIVAHVGFNRLMDELIVALTRAFQSYDEQETITPARAGFSYQEPQVGLLEWMPVMQKGQQATIKIVGYHPANPDLRNLPTIVSSVSLYDTDSGHLIGMIDGTFLTALRTGAASAIASRFLANPAARTVGLIGAGAQGLTQLHALSRLYEIDRVFVYDINPAHSGSFRKRASFMNLEIVPVEGSGLPLLVQSSDIICTATTVGLMEGPVFTDANCRPWLHVNAVGSDFPGKFEVPDSLLKRAMVVPDFYEQAVKEGECQRLDPTEIGPTLAEVVQNPEKYRPAQQKETVFDSTGWALEDQVAAKLIFDYASQLNLGREIEIESISDDPLDPYHFFRSNGTV